MLFAGAAVAIALAISPAVSAAQPDVTAPDTAPIVLAQAGAPASTAMQNLAVDPDAGAVHLRGVRQAARQGPDELRRYIFRTRMIYNFDYEDWAPKP
ncbi:MAG TPA: hypothetical protein VJV77_12820 [Casimicrobiaceae bacterium]|nr:hypothetical protein [Casimicrobiaceae bacterium]